MVRKKIRAIKVEIKPLAEIDYWVQQDPYTFVGVHVNFNGGVFAGYGFSKRNPMDEPNAELGKTIAFGRAIHHIAKEVLKKMVMDEFARNAKYSPQDLGKMFQTPDGHKFTLVAG